MTQNIQAQFNTVMDTMFLPHLPERREIALAVSGGPDSMALLTLLSRWGKYKIHALTVDHRLRKESTAEALQVGQWISNYPDVQHSILTWEHDGAPASRLQEAAREARYKLLADHMSKHNLQHLFLGHHLDDQAETILFRLAKGSGLDGLTGMSSYQKDSHGIFLCRPLLAFRKEIIMQYCEAHNIPFCQDPSNEAVRFARVRLRQSMTALEAEGLTPKRLATTAKRLERAREALDMIADNTYYNSILMAQSDRIVLNLKTLQDVPAEIGLRVLKLAMNDLHQGQGYILRLERFEDLFTDLMKPEAFRKRTLCGIIFERKDAEAKVILTLEA